MVAVDLVNDGSTSKYFIYFAVYNNEVISLIVGICFSLTIEFILARHRFNLRQNTLNLKSTGVTVLKSFAKLFLSSSKGGKS